MRPSSVPDASSVAALIGRQEFGAAERACREALAASPDDPVLNALLGHLGLRTARNDLAVEACRKATRLAPSYRFAYVTLGRGLRALGRHEEARAAFEVAHGLAPADAQTAVLLLEETLAAQGRDAMTATFARMESASAAPEVTQAVAELSAKEPPRSGEAYRLSPVLAWAAERNLPLRMLGDQEEIPIQTPPVLDGAEGRPAGPTTLVRSNRPYVAELRDVKVLSRSSLILTSDSVALHDAASHPLYGGQVSLRLDKAVVEQRDGGIVIDASPYSIDELEAGLFLAGLGSNAFGHWLPEFLPKLEYLAAHLEFATLPIIVDRDMPPSHFDYLRRLAPNPIFIIEPNRGVLCRRLVVAPSPTFYPTSLAPNSSIPAAEIAPLSPRALEFLRRAFPPGSPEGQNRFGPKLYLSRRNMTWRRLTNDAEIAAFLEAQGFQTVIIEDLSLDDQVRMFKGAEIIVAPNGSAMLNLIHAATDVKLLVLSQKGVFNWGGYYGPMHKLGYDMTFVLGDQEKGGKHSDYSVPVERVEAALASLT